MRNISVEDFPRSYGSYGTILTDNDGTNHKRVIEDIFIKDYLDWNRGRIIPKDSKFGNYDKSGKNNPFYGRFHTKETKSKIINTKKRNNDGG